MQKIVPNIWFDTQAEDAANFYVSVFPNSRILSTAHFPESEEIEKTTKKPGGSVMTVAFELNGQEYIALNGGPQFPLTEAISFIINCETQEEIDEYWEKLTADGGQPGPCGWLKDRFGLSWQVVPLGMDELFSDPDKEKSRKAMEAMMHMQKLDIKKLKEASEA